MSVSSCIVYSYVFFVVVFFAFSCDKSDGRQCDVGSESVTHWTRGITRCWQICILRLLLHTYLLTCAWNVWKRTVEKTQICILRLLLHTVTSDAFACTLDSTLLSVFLQPPWCIFCIFFCRLYCCLPLCNHHGVPCCCFHKLPECQKTFGVLRFLSHKNWTMIRKVWK